MRRLGRLALGIALALALPGTAAASTARAAGLAAYVHGYPPLLSAASQTIFPLNTLVAIAGPSDPSNRLIVLPNVDTAYAVVKLDLSAGPRMLHLPAEPGRYHVVQLIDGTTNVDGYVGTRTTGNGAVDAFIVGPDWHGTAPAGAKVLRSPTNAALLLGRTLLEPTDTLASMRALVGQYTLDGQAPLVLDAQPARPPAVVPTGLAFIDAFDAYLAANPPGPAERRALAPLARYGIGAGQSARAHALPARDRAALLHGLAAGPAAVGALALRREARTARRHRGWFLLGRRVGRFGTDYALRAIVARVGLWANTPDEAIYAIASLDADGHPLRGAHRYALAFPSAPPARAIWSLTMYGTALHLYENPLKRYALGDRSPGLVRHGTGVTLTLSHAAPERGKANWLPAPGGRFTVSLRLYVPTRAARATGWSPPAIRCLDCSR